MTEVQIDIEFEHFLLDKEEREKKPEQFEDDAYDEYDKDTDEKDERLFWEPGGMTERAEKVEHKITVPLPSAEISNQEDEWEDVEIDDF